MTFSGGSRAKEEGFFFLFCCQGLFIPMVSSIMSAEA